MPPPRLTSGADRLRKPRRERDRLRLRIGDRIGIKCL
jgi:hypothetical protein